MGRVDFYKDRVVINCLAKNLENAVEINEALEGHCLIGVLTKNYADVESCVKDVKAYMAKIKNVSVGLGAGDPKQWKMVADVSALTNPGHANEVFTGAMYCKGALTQAGATDTIINCLISPTGEVGKVKISTGPVSCGGQDIIVSCQQACDMLKDIGLNSVKFFNVHGLQHIEEIREFAKVAAASGLEYFEPTGGLTIENVKEVTKICLDAGCHKVIPHVYSSIINKETGLTDIGMAKQVYEQIKELF